MELKLTHPTTAGLGMNLLSGSNPLIIVISGFGESVYSLGSVCPLDYAILHLIYPTGQFSDFAQQALELTLEAFKILELIKQEVVFVGSGFGGPFAACLVSQFRKAGIDVKGLVLCDAITSVLDIVPRKRLLPLFLSRLARFDWIHRLTPVAQRLHLGQLQWLSNQDPDSGLVLAGIPINYIRSEYSQVLPETVEKWKQLTAIGLPWDEQLCRYSFTSLLIMACDTDYQTHRSSWQTSIKRAFDSMIR